MSISTKLEQSVKREFEGLEVVEASHSIGLLISAKDIKDAKRRDFANCVLAKTCKRQLKADKVAFMRTVAYVSHPDEDGVKKVHRYMVSPRAREIIESFDKGQPIVDGNMVYLTAPSECQTLNCQQVMANKSKVKKRAYISGTMSKQESEVYEKRVRFAEMVAKIRRSNGSDYNADPKIMDVRYGVGMVHFERKTIS